MRAPLGDHPDGERVLVEGLESTTRACSHCGFEGAVLRGGWKSKAETDPNTGHLCYRLRCPDCGRTEIVRLSV